MLKEYNKNLDSKIRIYITKGVVTAGVNSEINIFFKFSGSFALKKRYGYAI
jgi:hypothetical protein